jgi:hypothetical protein
MGEFHYTRVLYVGGGGGGVISPLHVPIALSQDNKELKIAIGYAWWGPEPVWLQRRNKH